MKRGISTDVSPEARPADGKRDHPSPSAPGSWERSSGALRRWAFVATSVGSMLVTFGIVSGLTHAWRLWLAMRDRG